MIVGQVPVESVYLEIGHRVEEFQHGGLAEEMPGLVEHETTPGITRPVVNDQDREPIIGLFAAIDDLGIDDLQQGLNATKKPRGAGGRDANVARCDAQLVVLGFRGLAGFQGKGNHLPGTGSLPAGDGRPSVQTLEELLPQIGADGLCRGRGNDADLLIQRQMSLAQQSGSQVAE